ncbi:unnamed protein product [Nesidiocoris tenuis]|uniref:Thioredoxin domain-containing protein n=1 Tax=Nesidiocoris tenuis TaxID=355587 RepID=A0A6H5GV37_9HEMI|nr:unnamed protein product [Nesidiocoris tenuis]
MFYDPFCPVCRKSAPDFEKLYLAMKDSLAFGTVDATSNQDLALGEDIKAFPTFRLYRCNGKCSHKSHEGRLTYDEMISFVAFSTLRDATLFSNGIHARKSELSYQNLKLLNSLSTPSKSAFFKWMLVPSQGSMFFSTTPKLSTIPKLPRKIRVGKRELTLCNQIMEVNSANFNKKLKSFNGALVFFYAPWCTHCYSMLEEFIKASDLIDQSVGVMAVCNAEESAELVDRFYVGKIPTLKYFRKDMYLTDYIGDIKVDQLVKFMNDPNVDEDFLRLVTSHRPKGDLYEGEILTPIQKKKLWQGKDGSELIVEITTSNIDRTLKENDSFLLLFYACWNKVCVGLKHDYINLAKAVENTDVVLGACDCEEHVDVADRFLITRFPTLKYFRNGLPVRDYIGDYHVESILAFLKDPTKLQIAPRSVGLEMEKSEDVDVPDYWKGIEGGRSLLHLNDFNYKTLVEQTPAMLLMFYVPWCKSCTPVKREFGQAALNLSREIGAFAACDAERNNEIADTYFVMKLPTIKYFRNGKFVVDYKGKRTAKDFIEFMKNPPLNPDLPPIAPTSLKKSEEGGKSKESELNVIRE